MSLDLIKDEPDICRHMFLPLSVCKIDIFFNSLYDLLPQ